MKSIYLNKLEKEKLIKEGHVCIYKEVKGLKWSAHYRAEPSEEDENSWDFFYGYGTKGLHVSMLETIKCPFKGNEKIFIQERWKTENGVCKPPFTMQEQNAKLFATVDIYFPTMYLGIPTEGKEIMSKKETRENKWFWCFELTKVEE